MDIEDLAAVGCQGSAMMMPAEDACEGRGWVATWAKEGGSRADDA
jgi:hypothetical protein